MMIQIEMLLMNKGIYFLTMLLLGLGLFGMISCQNYMKKLICMNIMQVAVIFFFLCFGQKEDATIPITIGNIFSPNDYINPLPHALMLTAIVVSLGTTGVGLALLTRIEEKYGTIEEQDLIESEKKF